MGLRKSKALHLLYATNPLHVQWRSVGRLGQENRLVPIVFRVQMAYVPYLSSTGLAGIGNSPSSDSFQILISFEA